MTISRPQTAFSHQVRPRKMIHHNGDLLLIGMSLATVALLGNTNYVKKSTSKTLCFTL